MRGARAGNENPPGRKMLQAKAGKPFISANGARTFGFALREGRGIENDESEFAGRGTQPVEDVSLNFLARAGGDRGDGLVQGKVARAGRERVPANIYVSDRACSTAGGIDGEGA